MYETSCGVRSGVKSRIVAKDAAVLTAAALLMRLIALAYQSWLAQRIGAAGMGLWQLVLSVNVLSVTLAVSGIRFTAARLVSEELGSGGDARAAVARCLCYAMIFGCLACLLTFFGAERIGFLWIGDARAVPCIRVFAFTLPMISLNCVLNGSFIASGKAWKSAVVQVAEQCVNVSAVMLLLRGVTDGDLARSCAAVARGNLIADAASLLLAAALRVLSGPERGGKGSARLTVRMLRIALPLAVSAYARTGLSTLEHLLVPRMLRRAGLSADASLGGYGTVTGMVFPLIAFPACLPGAVAELTVPALTAAQVRGERESIERTVGTLLRFTAAYSAAVAGLLFVCADALGALVYRSAAAGRWIRLLSPLVPVMYLDIVIDGCLKGLGQMMRSMRYNLSEAAIGLILVVTLLPRFGMGGYLAMLTFCELWNFSLSYACLRRITGRGLFPRRGKAADRPDGRPAADAS